MKNRNTNLAIALIICAIFLVGFLLSSGELASIAKKARDGVMSNIKYNLYYHCLALDRNARHYLLLPEGAYTESIFKNNFEFPLPVLLGILFSAMFNVLFQPMFLCVFTPQVVLNYLLFPFFIYGMVKYFTKIPIAIIIFFLVALHVGLYGSVVEALVRHRMLCDLIYLLIGLAGFTALTTKRS